MVNQQSGGTRTSQAFLEVTFPLLLHKQENFACYVFISALLVRVPFQLVRSKYTFERLTSKMYHSPLQAPNDLIGF